jgi:hypothetical protein
MIIRGDAAHRQRVRERLLSRTIVDLHGPRPVDDAPCWFFSGKPHKKTGYGQFSVGKQKGLLAHRVAYELFCGEIPDGYEVDHLCHPSDGSCPPATCQHRRCCNPAHLKAVTSRANTLRSTSLAAANAAKDYCDNGHAFTRANTYIGKNGARCCRACAREKRRRRVAAGLVKYEPKPSRLKCGRDHDWTPENTYIRPNGRRMCRACARIREEKYRGKSSEDEAA